MSSFILKRYAIPAVLATAGKALSGPKIATGVTIGGGVMDAKSTVEDREDKEEFDYSNSPQQKSYGVSQAVKEIGSGVGKGLIDYAKKSKSAMTGAAGFTAALGLGGYGFNRYKMSKEKVDSGERDATGLTTGEKIGTGLAATGAGALTAYTTGRSHDKSVNKLNESLSKSNKIKSQALNTIKNTNPNSTITTKLSDGTKLTTTGKDRINLAEKILNKENKKIADTTKTLADKNKSKLGGLVSNKKFKMGRNALLVGGTIAALGKLADSSLKSKSEQRSYTFARVGRMVKSALGYTKGGQNSPSVGSLLWDKAKSGDIKSIGKAAGTAVSEGGKELVRKASNFMTLGKSNDLTNSMYKNLKNSGEYGKKAADFMRKHKTATMAVGAAGVGIPAFNAIDSVTNKAVNSVTGLDKETNEFRKRQEEEMGNV